MTKSFAAALALAVAIPAVAIGFAAPAHAEQLSAEAELFGRLYVPAEL
ncbi:MAG: hypothetical protein RLZZ58_2341, partial [Pseudomonadota bacterium]